MVFPLHGGGPYLKVSVMGGSTLPRIAGWSTIQILRMRTYRPKLSLWATDNVLLHVKEWGLYLRIIFAFRAATCQAWDIWSGRFVVKQSEYSGTCPRTELDHLQHQALTDLFISVCVSVFVWLHVICVYADAPWVWPISELLPHILPNQMVWYQY